MTKKVLFGSIILTTALLAFANVALQDYLTAALAFAVGSIWLILIMNNKEPPNSLFFLFFIGLAIVGSLRDIPTPDYAFSGIRDSGGMGFITASGKDQH